MSKHGKYHKLNDGESFHLDLDNDNLRFACCDCGKVHKFTFKHIKNNIWDIAIFSFERATAQLRRHCYGDLQNPYGDYKLVKQKRVKSLWPKRVNG